MTLKKKAPRQKLNKIQIQRKIDEDLKRRWLFLLPGKNSNEFILPGAHPFNRLLFHELPMTRVNSEGKVSQEGKLGQPKYYYIPNPLHKKLNALFSEFKLPTEIYPDLTVAYLGMYFASCTASHDTHFHADLKWKQSESFETLDLLENFATEKIMLRGIEFSYCDVIEKATQRSKPNLGPLKTKKIQGHIAIQLIEKVLQIYKQIQGYGIYMKSYELNKQHGHSDLLFGHKNAASLSQAYFSRVIFDYLRENLCCTPFQFLPDDEKYKSEWKRIKRMYSRRKLFLFTGKLMQLSTLLKTPTVSDDNQLIQIIQKKLRGHLQAERLRLIEIRNHNRNSKDGTAEITPAAWLL